MSHSLDSNTVNESSRCRRPGRVFLGVALVLAMSARGSNAQPAAEADAKAKPLAHYVPSQNLISYLEFGGLDTHQAAWRTSAAYKLLNETKLGSLLEDLAGQYLEVGQQYSRPDRAHPGSEIIAMMKLATRQGFALGVWGKDPDQFGTIYVMRGGDRPEVRRLLELAARPLQNPGGAEPVPGGPKPIEKAGRSLHSSSEETDWWIEKGDLILTNQPDTVLAVLDGKESDAVSHPLRTALLKGEGGFQPVAIGFVDFAKLPPMPPEVVRLGLDGVKRIEFAWASRARPCGPCSARSPRRRAADCSALLDQPDLRRRLPAADTRRLDRVHRALDRPPEGLRPGDRTGQEGQ